MTREEDCFNLSQSRGRGLCNDRKGNASHYANGLYVGMARLSVHLGLGASPSPSATASPSRSPDEGGWGVTVEVE